MRNNHSIQIRPILPALLAIIIDSLGFGLVYPVFTALLASKNSAIVAGMNLTTREFFLGLGYMLYPLAMLFGASFMGDLSDLWGRKKTLIICMLGITASLLLMGFGAIFSSMTLLLVGRGLSGLVAGSQPIAQAAVADKSTQENKASHMGLVTITISIGIVVGPLLGGFLSDRAFGSFFNFATPFFFCALIALLNAIWLKLSFHETFHTTRDSKFHIARPITLFIDAWKADKVREISWIFFLMQVGFGIFYQYSLVIFKMEYHYANWALGTFTAFLGCCFIPPMIWVMPRMTKHFSIESIAFWTLLITGISEVAFRYTQFGWLLWILAIPTASADIMAYTALMTIFSNSVGEQSQGWVMGIFGAVLAISWATVGVSTNLVPYLGNRGLLLIGGILMILSALFMMHFKTQKDKIRIYDKAI